MRIIECHKCKDTYIFKNWKSHQAECDSILINKQTKKIKDLRKQIIQKDNIIKQFDSKSYQFSRKNNNLYISLDNNLDGSEKAEIKNNIINKKWFSNSSIISENKTTFLNILIDNRKASLIYTMSKDGEGNFHKRCNGIKPTLCVALKTKKKQEYMIDILQVNGIVILIQA